MQVLGKAVTPVNSYQAALRALQILALRGSVGVSEVARELGVPRSTAHRVLANIVATGHAQQDHSGGRYHPGPALYDIAFSMAAPVDLHTAASASLEDLHAAVGLLVTIGILEGRSVRYVNSLGGEQSAGSRLGRVVPAHASAAGKAILAFSDEVELKRHFQGRAFQAVTDRSITTWDRLSRQLKSIRTRGWATAIGESEVAINEVAAPIMVLSGRPSAAVSVWAPSPRLQLRPDVMEVVPQLVSAAARIQWLTRKSISSEDDAHEAES